MEGIMKKILTTIVFSYLFVGITLTAQAEPKSIILKDGSVIQGEVIGFSSGIYTVKTANLGEIQIQDKNIQAIAAKGAANPQKAQNNSSSNAEIQRKVQAMQGSILSDPQMMNEIQSLMNNPEIMRLMADENFIQEVMSMDPEKLEKNPKMKELMNNPEMLRVIRRLQGQMEGR